MENQIYVIDRRWNKIRIGRRGVLTLLLYFMASVSVNFISHVFKDIHHRKYLWDKFGW